MGGVDNKSDVQARGYDLAKGGSLRSQGPKVAPLKTKKYSGLAYYFFRESHIQQQKRRSGLQQATTRVRFSSETAYPVTRSAQARHTMPHFRSLSDYQRHIFGLGSL